MNNQASQTALKGIRSLAFELLQDSPEQERKINIEDSGEYCTIQMSVRVVREEFQKSFEKLGLS